MNTKQNQSIFSTDNFCLAAFLKTKNCRLLSISKQNPRRAFFNFKNSKLTKQLTKDFWDGKTLIEPRLYNATQKELKTLLYDSSYPGNTNHK